MVISCGFLNLCSEINMACICKIVWTRICCLFHNAEFNLPFSASISLKSRSEFFKDRTPGVSVSCSVVDTFGLFSSGSVFMLSLIVSFFTTESHLGVSFGVVVARSPQCQLMVSSHQFSRSSARITTLSEMARTSSCERFAEHRTKN